MRGSLVWRSIQAVVLILTLAVCCYFGGSQLLPVMAMEQGGRPVVILDPGHGGEDGGASTASGQQESEINLDIVLKLELLMAFCGVETKLTRDTDVSLHDPGAEETGNRKQSDLDHRVQLVESTPNAMLISIHQNHFSDSRVSGAQVFYSLGDWPRQWGEATQQALVQCLNKSNTKASKPISQGTENGLLYKRWIERNRQIVDKLSNNRIAYVHIKAMDAASFQTLYKELMSDENR